MNFKSLNLSNSGLSLNSPISRQSTTQGLDFETNYDIQTRKLRISQTNINDFITNSDVSTASGTFGTGQALFVSTSLTPNIPYQMFPNFAVPYVAIYQGTAASAAFQIYPTSGGSITPSQYSITGSFDWHDYQGDVGSYWSGQIQNVSAGAQSVYFVTQWKYILYNTAANS